MSDSVADAYGDDVPREMDALDAETLLIEAYGRRERREAPGLSLAEERAALLLSAAWADADALSAAQRPGTPGLRFPASDWSPALKRRQAGDRAVSLIRFDAANGTGRAVSGAAAELVDAGALALPREADCEAALAYVRAEWTFRNDAPTAGSGTRAVRP